MLIQKGRGVWQQEEGTRFLVVDLDVISKRSLSTLIKAFDRHLVGNDQERYGSRYLATFHARGWNLTADREIHELATAVKKLPKEARMVWDRAQSREFNIGIAADREPRLREFMFSPRTIALVAQVRATIVITVYAPEAAATRLKPRNKSRQRSG